MFSGLENPFHLLILAVIVLLVFGPKRLPELGRSLGSGLRGFKASLSGEHESGEARESDTARTMPTAAAAGAEQVESGLVPPAGPKAAAPGAGE